MQIVIALIGAGAAGLLFYFFYLLMKGEKLG